MSAKSKTCVACAEEIKAEAILCRFCGTNQSGFKPSRSPDSVSNEPPQESRQDGQNLALTMALNAAKVSWVLAGGFAALFILGFRPDGVYGPWQPVGVFSLGVLVLSLTALIAMSVAISPKRPRTNSLRAIRLGLIPWASLAFLITVVAYVIGINHYSAGQEIDAESDLASAEASTVPTEVPTREPEPPKPEVQPLPKTEPIVPQKSQYELDIEKSASEQLRTCQALFAHDFTSMNNSWGQPGHGAIVLGHYDSLWSSLQNDIPLGDFNVYRDRMLDALLVYGQIASMYEEIEVYDSWEVWTPQQTFQRQYETLVALC